MWNEEWNNNPNLEVGNLNFYENIYEEIQYLARYKFDPYQPSPYPNEELFLNRLQDWIEYFDEEKQKYVFYLSSKIIFFTRRQIDFLIQSIYERKIKKKILNEIISEKGLQKFDYIQASVYYRDELDKTLFLGLTDSSRINDFLHTNVEIDREKSTSEDLDLLTLLFPTKSRINSTNQDLNKISEDFEKQVLIKNTSLKKKTRLVVLEDFCGSGSDFILNLLEIINKSNLQFKTIILAPYIITYQGKKSIKTWIKNHKSSKFNVILTYGGIIPEDSMCFDQPNSYLRADWKDPEIDICEEIKNISIVTYNKYFSNYLKPKDQFGFNALKYSFVYFYNCPDNSIPIIWCDKKGFKPLFKRSSRII